MIKYKVTDVSIIIPTYNRQEELIPMLQHLKKFKVKEIIVVDQSKSSIGDKVRKLGKRFKYVMNTIPSITAARNLGVRVSKGKIICFLDDDVFLADNYFEEILNLIRLPFVEGVAAYTRPKVNYLSRVFDKLAGLFFLKKYSKYHSEINGAFSNSYPLDLAELQQINYLLAPFSQWLPGVNMVFKREVFNHQSFDENLKGYTLAEDIDFTYRLYLSNMFSLMITSKTYVTHLHSQSSRPDLRKMRYINMVDHFYFYYKNLADKKGESFKLVVSLMALSIFNILSLLTLKKEKFIKCTYFFKALGYCLTHKNEIKKGDVRGWL